MADKEYITIDRFDHDELMERLTKKKSGVANRRYTDGFNDALLRFRSMLHSAPTADVVEVRHERFKWGYQNGQYGIWCAHCGAGWVDSENAEWIAREHDYCPKCGAKMDGKGEGE